MRRFFGLVLVGLGGLLIVFAIGLPVYVAPSVTKLPYDMQLCPPDDQEQPEGCLKPSVAEATGAQFLQRDGLEIRQGTLRSTTEVVPQAKKTADWQGTAPAIRLGDNAIIWDVYGEARWVDGNDALISAYSTELAIDRATGAGIDWDGQWLDEDDLGTIPQGNVNYDGAQVYKFPFGTEKKDYLIYDRDLRRALPAQFVEVTTVGGLEAYLFRQTIAPQDAQNVSPASLNALRGRFAPSATSAKVVYSNTREVWVDPVTGAYLDVREQQNKTLVPADGTDGETTLLRADFRYTEETVANAVESAKGNHSRLMLVKVYGPILLGVVALILLVVAFVLFRGGRRVGPAGAPGEEPGGWEATLPKARHKLRT
jgi:hypothetical protein